jgi:glycosyltransferase involved in cell wall biosynthesis
MIGFLNYAGDARVRAYGRWLIDAGSTVDVLGLHELQAREAMDQSGVRLYSIPVSWTRKNRMRYLLEYGLFFLHLTYLVNRLYFKKHYDVIHVHNMPNFLIFCGLIPKLFGAKLVLDVHDTMPEVYLSKFPAHENSLAIKLLRLEEKLSTAFAHEVIAANPHFRDNLIARGVPAAKITTIHNFPDPAIFNPSKRLQEKDRDHTHFTLIFPGTIAERYGLEVAVRALPLLKDEIPNVRLLVIGRQDEYVKTLNKLAAQLGVASLLEICPSMPNNEIPGKLMQAEAGIYPALPDRHMSIAIPGKVLEFAIMGLPIISSRLQIVEEMFDDSAVLFFEPGNIEQFALCVLRLYQDPQLRKELVRQADRALAQQPCWEQEADTFMSLVRRLLNRREEAPATERSAS